ncbi:lipid-A-disaccharide synthase N-terminal domain-containing protein [Luteirhabdus pelagi]|uniref:lipid-A-disaccharide synthase N-terminal domain-containing protein n=1 Tax=Luteirhabdus pelagi TaxID=2792783 RepID=UPI00193A67E2|nr:lipid-A-disaccharide synthase N-terminal domain-containing protein [Luteirhabdus pelagi]
MIEQLSYITLIGFLGQGLFFSRFLVQWLLSEKHKKVITPSVFWKLSLLASIIFFIYGYLREDFAIMLGQSLTYFIYIRNLQLQGEWQKMHRVFQWLFFAFPLFIVIYSYNNGEYDLQQFFSSNNIAPWLLVLGIVSQLVFIFRFVFQWLVSERSKTSQLPLGFWAISLTGSVLILLYSIFRQDIVLFSAHSVGMIVYIRNIIIWRKERRTHA